MSVKQVCNSILHVEDINLETGLKYVSNSVYMLSNDDSKTIFISYTTNLCQSLGRLLGDIKSNSGEHKTLKDDIENVKLYILETNLETGQLKLRTAYWSNLYADRGYKFYKQMNLVNYTLETTIGYKEGKVHYFCYLVNKRKDKILIGMFSKKKEMSSFLRTNYPNFNRIGKVVLHDSVKAHPSVNES